MSLPEDCRPRAPAPPSDARIEVAAREICEALARSRFERQRGEERAIDLRDACSGFPKFGCKNPIPTDDYRWAVKRMVGTGLLVCVEVKKSEPWEDDIIDWSCLEQQVELPRFEIISTPQLWLRRRGTEPVLGASAQSSRIHCEKPNRSVWVDNEQIASELDEEVFDYLAVLVESYPKPISFKEIKKLVPTLTENQTRLRSKVKDKLPRSFWKKIEIQRKPSQGHVLKLLLD
jgi:hypothetical protein